MDFGFTSVAAITVICYLVMEILKTTSLNRKWLPIISGLLGGGVGALAMLIMPSYPASDYLNAVAIGIVSGLAATGVNQAAKQLKSSR
jgi:multisubunit Na+/H+ antiporter MnhB subunit